MKNIFCGERFCTEDPEDGFFNNGSPKAERGVCCPVSWQAHRLSVVM